MCCQGKYSHQDKEGKPTAATAAAADAASQSPVNDGASTSGTSPMVCCIVEYKLRFYT